jgi:hypothetical protein
MRIKYSEGLLKEGIVIAGETEKGVFEALCSPAVNYFKFYSKSSPKDYNLSLVKPRLTMLLWRIPHMSEKP